MRRGIEKRNNNGVTTPIRTTGIRDAAGRNADSGDRACTARHRPRVRRRT